MTCAGTDKVQPLIAADEAAGRQAEKRPRVSDGVSAADWQVMV